MNADTRPLKLHNRHECIPCLGTGRIATAHDDDEECRDCGGAGGVEWQWRDEGVMDCNWCGTPQPCCENGEDPICRNCMLDLHVTDCGCVTWCGAKDPEPTCLDCDLPTVEGGYCASCKPEAARI